MSWLTASPAASWPFEEIVLFDTEFFQPGGELPHTHCLVARGLRSGRVVRLWRDSLVSATGPPFSTGPGTLWVAYYSSAEAGCFLEFGWPLPQRVLDLFTEFRVATNGVQVPCGNGLLGALTYYGLSGMAAQEKASMRALALRGGIYTEEEQRMLLDYCRHDVDALEHLLRVMAPDVDLPRALLRGRYMNAAARMERVGVPIDTGSLTILRELWPEIQGELIGRIDQDYGVYDGLSFRYDRFEALLRRSGIPWPRLPSGRLSLTDDDFRDMARAYAALGQLRELRVALSQMRSIGLEVGRDGRNRVILSAFSSKTGRNQPSNSKFIFGPATWLRSLIKPPPGYGIAYIDFSQEEFAIAAALSGDENMMAAYTSGDPYLSLAVLAGAAPPGATKQTHGSIRERFKTLTLAVQYGGGVGLISLRTGLPEAYARELLRHHQRGFAKYWAWSEAVLNYGSLNGHLDTVFGWRLHVTADPHRAFGPNPRSLVNFPTQGNGAEVLRIACILATEAGIRVCCPVHDALLIEAPLEQLDEAITVTRQAMTDASKIVLNGFEIRTDVKVVRFPDRYSDARGVRMWEVVGQIIRERRR